MMNQIVYILLCFIAVVYAQQPSTVPLLNAPESTATNIAPVIRIRQPAAVPQRRSGYVPLPTPSIAAESLTSNNLDGEETANYPREPYNFGYDVRDEFGNRQYRREESDANGVVRGTYGYTDGSNGLFRYVDYISDSAGYRVSIRSNEPGITGAQAANVALSSEEPPKSIVDSNVNQYPRRRIGLELESSARSAEINHVASGSDAVERAERIINHRYTLPLAKLLRENVVESTTSNTANDSSSPSSSSTSSSTSSSSGSSHISYATRISHTINPK